MEGGRAGVPGEHRQLAMWARPAQAVESPPPEVGQGHFGRFGVSHSLLFGWPSCLFDWGTRIPFLGLQGAEAQQ